MGKKKNTSDKYISVDSYNGLLSSVSELLEQARRTSARTVNTILTATYWEIGRRILEFEQGGETRAEYGEQVLERLSADLTRRFGRGFSIRNLRSFRMFYIEWRNRQTLFADSSESGIFQTLSGKSDSMAGNKIFQTSSGILQTPSAISATVSRKFVLSDLSQAFPLPWSHYVRLLSVENQEARSFYEVEAIRGGWSVRQLNKWHRRCRLYFFTWIEDDTNK